MKNHHRAGILNGASLSLPKAIGHLEKPLSGKISTIDFNRLYKTFRKNDRLFEAPY